MKMPSTSPLSISNKVSKTPSVWIKAAGLLRSKKTTITREVAHNRKVWAVREK